MNQSLWDFNNDNPERRIYVEEWQHWLAEVEDASQRQDLDTRLRSGIDNDFFSARLELYFHHLFKSQGCTIAFHPRPPNSKRHPDLLVGRENGLFYLEATIRQDEPSFAAQEAFLDSLASELQDVMSPHRVHPQIYRRCPERNHLPHIRTFLIDELDLFDTAGEAEKEVVWTTSTYGTRYELCFSLHRGSGPPQALIVGRGAGSFSESSVRLYEALDEKAGKYGDLDLPFMIGMWGLSYTDQVAEEEALFGTLGFAYTQTTSREQHDDTIEDSGRAVRSPDGLFTLLEQGRPRYSKVSAVAFYRCMLGDTEAQHSLRIYHNPHASLQLSQAVFQGFPQLVPSNGQMRWIDRSEDSPTM